MLAVFDMADDVYDVVAGAPRAVLRATTGDAPLSGHSASSYNPKHLPVFITPLTRCTCGGHLPSDTSSAKEATLVSFSGAQARLRAPKRCSRKKGATSCRNRYWDNFTRHNGANVNSVRLNDVSALFIDTSLALDKTYL